MAGGDLNDPVVAMMSEGEVESPVPALTHGEG